MTVGNREAMFRQWLDDHQAIRIVDRHDPGVGGLVAATELVVEQVDEPVGELAGIGGR